MQTSTVVSEDDSWWLFLLVGRLCDGLLCSITFFLMQTSMVVSEDDSWWLFLLAGRLCDGLLCSITFFLMQMSTVVSEEDRGGCSCWLVDCVMVFYVPSPSF
jgi:hypothetical protein